MELAQSGPQTHTHFCASMLISEGEYTTYGVWHISEYTRKTHDVWIFSFIATDAYLY